MNKLLLLIMLLVLAACGSPPPPELSNTKLTEKDALPKTSSPTSLRAANAAKDPVYTIRQVVEHINGQKLEIKHIEFMCDELMKVDRFYEHGKLVKITVDFGTIGDTYAKEDYYYDKGELIFKYEFVEGGPACEDCIKKNEYRSYIKNNKVIKYLKNQEVAKCRTCSFEKSSRYYKLLNVDTEEDTKKILCR